MIVLDTHSLLWWSMMPEYLSENVANSIETATTLGVPTITLWELALLQRKGKLDLGIRMMDFCEKILSIPRIQELPLDAKTAIQADSLNMHPDPADRFIVATTIRYEAVLATKDKLIQQLPFVETIW